MEQDEKKCCWCDKTAQHFTPKADLFECHRCWKIRQLAEEDPFIAVFITGAVLMRILGEMPANPTIN